MRRGEHGDTWGGGVGVRPVRGMEGALLQVPSDEVQAALGEGRVVALESSLVAQGMPWPENLETALAMEEAVRRAGAVPATVAVVQGQVLLGAPRRQLEELARAGGGAAGEAARAAVVKVGLQDLAWVQLQGATGGTTVSATLAVAAAAGVRVFATGGIGGVHRENPHDISTDLVALARYPVMVVCSGAKAFLDVPRTLELLETLGVPVIGYRTDTFPGFFTRATPYPVTRRLDDPGAVVRLARRAWAWGGGGILVAQPVPEEAALPQAEVDRAVAEAVQAAAEQGVTGKATTPFLLEQIRHRTGGRSLAANMRLAVANAGLAGELARRWAALAAEGEAAPAPPTG